MDFQAERFQAVWIGSVPSKKATVNFVVLPGQGANETVLVDERLASYYFCLDSREREVVKSGRISPRMVVSQSGLHAIMHINIAEPEHFWENRRFYWKFRPWSESDAKISLEDDPFLKVLPVEEKDDDESNEMMDSLAGGADLDPSATTTRAPKNPTPNPSFLINEPYHTLFILSVQNAKSSGEYFCFDEDDQISAVYHLDVVEKDPYKTVGLNPDEPDWFILPAYYPEYGVEVITEWSSWTSCDRCGYVAERRRYGKCIVRPVEKHKDVPEGDWMPALQELFFLYPSGLPCRTSWLPEIVRNLTEVAGRPNFIHISFCK
uniref:Uncharacterized protein n=1 Tax=Romanomermis culicivorax TaxID=13658 RepID=A0A915L218_ROMCU